MPVPRSPRLLRWVWILPAVAALVGGCASRAGRSPRTSTGLPYYPPAATTSPESPFPAVVSTRAVRGERLVVRTPEGAAMSGIPAVGRKDAGASEMISDEADVWIAAAERWRGTPYRLGGEDRSGMDCSAFSRALHREVSGIELPRTTVDQALEGIPVRKGAPMQPGDLVFFRARPGAGWANHVGVVLDGKRFAHAATSTGVTINRLDDSYWADRWSTSRRLR